MPQSPIDRRRRQRAQQARAPHARQRARRGSSDAGRSGSLLGAVAGRRRAAAAAAACSTPLRLEARGRRVCELDEAAHQQARAASSDSEAPPRATTSAAQPAPAAQPPPCAPCPSRAAAPMRSSCALCSAGTSANTSVVQRRPPGEEQHRQVQADHRLARDRPVGDRAPRAACRPREAGRSPRQRPASASSRLSTSCCRTSRPRPPPTRGAQRQLALARPAARASSRLATLAQAISSSRIAAAAVDGDRRPVRAEDLVRQRRPRRRRARASGRTCPRR